MKWFVNIDKSVNINENALLLSYYDSRKPTKHYNVHTINTFLNAKKRVGLSTDPPTGNLYEDYFKVLSIHVNIILFTAIQTIWWKWRKSQEFCRTKEETVYIYLIIDRLFWYFNLYQRENNIL